MLTNQVPSVQVGFCVRNATVHKIIVKQEVMHHIHNFPYKCICPHFTKTQSLTLSSIFLALDAQIFSAGQAYRMLQLVDALLGTMSLTL